MLQAALHKLHAAAASAAPAATTASVQDSTTPSSRMEGVQGQTVLSYEQESLLPQKALLLLALVGASLKQHEQQQHELQQGALLSESTESNIVSNNRGGSDLAAASDAEGIMQALHQLTILPCVDGRWASMRGIALQLAARRGSSSPEQTALPGQDLCPDDEEESVHEEAMASVPQLHLSAGNKIVLIHDSVLSAGTSCSGSEAGHAVQRHAIQSLLTGPSKLQLQELQNSLQQEPVEGIRDLFVVCLPNVARTAATTTQHDQAPPTLQLAAVLQAGLHFVLQTVMRLPTLATAVKALPVGVVPEYDNDAVNVGTVPLSSTQVLRLIRAPAELYCLQQHSGQQPRLDALGSMLHGRADVGQGEAADAMRMVLQCMDVHASAMLTQHINAMLPYACR